METIDAFSLEKHEGPYKKWPRKTRLFFNGEDTGNEQQLEKIREKTRARSRQE